MPSRPTRSHALLCAGLALLGCSGGPDPVETPVPPNASRTGTTEAVPASPSGTVATTTAGEAPVETRQTPVAQPTPTTTPEVASAQPAQLVPAPGASPPPVVSAAVARLPIDEGASDPPGFAARRVAIQELLNGHTDRDDEARILVLMREAPAGELDRLVRRLDLGSLFESLDDHSFGGPQHYTEVCELLSTRRLGDLSLQARAALVDAFQRGSTDEVAERTLEALFRGTRGIELTRLKNAVDGGRDAQDLLKLFQHDLDDAERSARIKAHLAAEGAAVPACGIKVLHDIDDTLFSSLKDDRWPSGVVYPGVLALEKELCHGNGDRETGGELVFLTARPDDRAHVVEEQTFATLARMGVGPCTILAGGMLDFRSNEAMAAGKRANFDAYRPLFPEYRFVFLGDSGQGDVIFGRGIRKDHPELVPLVLIHDVVATPAEKRAEIAQEGVIHVDTWLGGAVEARTRGLISEEGLARVAEATLADFGRVTFDDEAMRAARKAELLADLERANALLSPGLRVSRN